MKKETKLLQRSYHIPLPMFDEAFRCFQRRFVIPMQIVVTVIFLVIAADFVWAAFKEPDNPLTYLLIVACISLVLVRWYRMFKLRRAVHDALQEIEQDRYELTVYEDGVVIRTEDMPVQKAEQPGNEEKTENEPEQGAGASEGFQQLFPEEKAEEADAVQPTEITFGRDVKLLEYPEFFMIYLVRANFYVIPKKDFTEEENKQLSVLFSKYQ